MMTTLWKLHKCDPDDCLREFLRRELRVVLSRRESSYDHYANKIEPGDVVVQLFLGTYTCP